MKSISAIANGRRLAASMKNDKIAWDSMNLFADVLMCASWPTKLKHVGFISILRVVCEI